uniref:Chondroitin sulfate proteoglycan 4-like n=1 Tax=Sinocyclocheilus rhinocerous TaxID=307959 RepID=A0A673H3G6_9TELE
MGDIFLCAASFYGDGFVQLKGTEMSSRNTLHVRFRTSSLSGLLFLAAGQNDFLLLEMNAGRLQVRLDLGSGEHILLSDSGTQLNDLAWHTAELFHDIYNVTLTVDNHSKTSLRMAGPERELHINDGLYVGGTGGLDQAYLSRDLNGFRGCLDEIIFNQHNLLSSLRPYSGFKNVYEVSLGCNPQFFANEDDPISFFSSRAYVSLPPWTAQHEWTFECSIHTSAEEGIVMFNSARQGDFVALEIQKGLLAAVIGKDGSKTELRSLTFINDNKWHNVKLLFTPKNLQLTLDGETVKSVITSRSKTFHLKGSLFLGGIDDSTRSEVRKAGLSSVAGKRVKGGSFKGCFRDIKINNVKMGLPNAVVTKDISVGCEPEKELDISSTVSPTTLPMAFIDSVTQLPSTDVSTLAKGLVKKYRHNFLQLRNLVVPEGGRGSLDSKHIKVNLDFKKLGIRQSQIIFRIEEQPVHGQLRLDVDQEQAKHTFSMLDLWHGRVMYIHGGSEDPQDFFMFSLFSSSRKEVPGYLSGHKLYRFNVTVTATNDAPELSLPEGNLFTLLENSKKRLTTDVLKAIDIDSSYTDLVYSVLGNLNADAGYLENEDNPGALVTSFPHSALVDGKIYYVHTGVRNSRIVLRVSDGEKVSNTVVLRIMAVGLKYKISNNTGLEVIQGEMFLLSTNQLAIWTNALKQVVEIRYDVIEPPRFGELQRMHSSGEWKMTKSFSQRVLEKERLRYLSTYQSIQTSNSTDHFKCKVTVASRATEEFVFPIKVKWIDYTIKNNKPVELDKITRAVFDSEHLYAIAHGVNLSEDELRFRLLTLPKKGIIEVNNAKLDVNSTFCQKDITDLKVEYQLTERSYEDTSDEFVFYIFSKHAHSGSHIFKINIKADVNNIFMTNNGLSLLEGESKLITKDELFAETLSTKEMYCTVTKTPHHGKLMRINLSNSTKDFENIMSFTNQDVLEERIMYIHDDSETTLDSFTFIASTSPVTKLSITDNDIGSKEGIFNISIELVNDEKPIRIVDKVFHVVRNGQRLLTLDDLCYHDADSDFSDGQLVYTRRGIPIGDLVLANDTSQKLYQFRQEDLEQKQVLFIHRGMNSGRFVLFVSDGKHYVSSLLDISAQDAYLKIGNNTGLLVQKGQAKTLTNANFSVETNLDIRKDNEILFTIQDAPNHGGLYLKGSKIESFTQHDLRNGHLSYHHDNSKNLADVFTLLVEAKDLRLDVKIHAKVYLESHQRPPSVIHNKTLLVEEGKPVRIESNKLKVTHEASLPSEITFTVKVAPSHGYLRHFIEVKDQYQGTQEDPLVTFSQRDVNAGNIQYVQVAPGQESDSFTLEASNGVAEVNDIIMSVDIIPGLIPIEVSNITLKEGASKALTEDVISVTNPHFSGLNFVYYVSEGPLHGRIENSRFRGIPTTYFTRKQVKVSQFLTFFILKEWTLKRHKQSLKCFCTLFCILFIYYYYIYILYILKCIMLFFYYYYSYPGVAVTEGDKVLIDKSMLDASNLMTKQPESKRSSYEVWYQVTSLPKHGVIVVGQRNLTKEKPNFSQFVLNKYGITYHHDNSETTHDPFDFDVYLNIKSEPPTRPLDTSEVVSESFNITIIPINDQPPVLKTKAPSLKVVQGDTVAIEPNNLSVVDLDNPPSEIQYTVISKPSNGFLAISECMNESVDSFSQAQINNGEVFFIHDGSPSSGAFYFSVTDGHHRPLYKLFNLEVVEITVSLANNTEVLLDQGHTFVTLTRSHLAAVTNGKNTTVHYKITVPPQYGKLLLDNEDVTVFSQDDLQEEKLRYHMVNLESSHDNFEFVVFTTEANLTNQVVNITVKPLIKYADGATFPNGVRIKLKSHLLNVSELALLSDSDPLFEMTSPPENGRIVRATGSKGKKAESVGSFTFSELQQEILAIELKANLTGVHEVNDSFRFVLKANNVQPANGIFAFSIVPHVPTLVMPTVIPITTIRPVFHNQTTAMSLFPSSTAPPVQPSHRVTKSGSRLKGRNRWGSSNSIDTGTTNLKPTHEVEEIYPINNTPVKVESVSQTGSSSNSMIILLPLLALLLLVIIVVVLVLLLRRNWRKKPKPLKSSTSGASAHPDNPSHQDQPQWPATVPVVTVTPLTPRNAGSSTITRLQTRTYGTSVCSFGDLEPEVSQLCRTTNPTLRNNQYWV